MTASFNLLECPWIPCHVVGTAVPQDLSLRETLERAHEVIGIEADSPLETIAVHRLLLAVLHRIFRVVDDSDWSVLWEAGRFDAALIDAWADAWRHRFDLFDDERPFYQTLGLPQELSLDIRSLGHEYAVADDKPTLFDHSTRTAPAPLRPAKAARLLLAHQLFARGGTITPVPPATKYAKGGPLYKGAAVLVRGSSLFETLVLNMVRVDGPASEPWQFHPDDDLPAWERAFPAQAVNRDPKGYLDYLTWQTRRILLITQGSGEDLRAVRCVIGVGEQFVSPVAPHPWEQMFAFKVDRDAKNDRSPYTPLGFTPERALWRDSLTLLTEASPTSQQPQNLKSLAVMCREAGIDRSFSVSALGLRYDPNRVASVVLWREESLPLPLSYLSDERLVHCMRVAVMAAEQAGQALRQGVWLAASETLGPGRTSHPRRAADLLKSLAPLRAYWPALDVPFREYMLRLAQEYESDYGEAANAWWAEQVSNAARGAFEQTCRALETESRGYRAAAEATPRFRFLLSEALKPLQPEPPTEIASELVEVSS